MSELPLLTSTKDEEIASLKAELEAVKAEMDELKEENLLLLNAMACFPDSFLVTDSKALAKRDLWQKIKTLDWVLKEFSDSMNSVAEAMLRIRIDELKQQAEVDNELD